jgi:hypothetical protein
VHPIEHLRFMAQAGEVDSEFLIAEAALALSQVAFDRAELVLACRQLLEHRPASGPLVWLAARMVSGADPYLDGVDASESIRRDKTPRELHAAIADGSRVVIAGAPELSSRVLADRADLTVLVVDGNGDGQGLVHRLAVADHDVEDVPVAALASAVASADLVLLEAEALGPDAALAPVGSLAAATAGSSLGCPVWMVAGVGRKLPAGMWSLLTQQLVTSTPWRQTVEVVPLEFCDRLVTPAGLQPVTQAAVGSDCPLVPELFR